MRQITAQLRLNGHKRQCGHYALAGAVTEVVGDPTLGSLDGGSMVVGGRDGRAGASASERVSSWTPS